MKVSFKIISRNNTEEEININPSQSISSWIDVVANSIDMPKESLVFYLFGNELDLSKSLYENGYFDGAIIYIDQRNTTAYDQQEETEILQNNFSVDSDVEGDHNLDVESTNEEHQINDHEKCFTEEIMKNKSKKAKYPFNIKLCKDDKEKRSDLIANTVKVSESFGADPELVTEAILSLVNLDNETIVSIEDSIAKGLIEVFFDPDRTELNEEFSQRMKERFMISDDYLNKVATLCQNDEGAIEDVLTTLEISEQLHELSSQ